MLKYFHEDLERYLFVCENCGTEWGDREAIYNPVEPSAEYEFGECCFACDLTMDHDYTDNDDWLFDLPEDWISEFDDEVPVEVVNIEDEFLY